MKPRRAETGIQRRVSRSARWRREGFSAACKNDHKYSEDLHSLRSRHAPGTAEVQAKVWRPGSLQPHADSDTSVIPTAPLRRHKPRKRARLPTFVHSLRLRAAPVRGRDPCNALSRTHLREANKNMSARQKHVSATYTCQRDRKGTASPMSAVSRPRKCSTSRPFASPVCMPASDLTCACTACVSHCVSLPAS